MPDKTYTATLDNGASNESIELELIAGEPQKSFIRAATIDGRETVVVWELDSDAEAPIYRIASGSGYGEAGTS